MRVRAVCENCRKDFYALKCQVKKGMGKFCSGKCRGESMKGAKNPHWKGGRIKDGNGYIFVYRPDHPYCNSMKYVREHRLVMEAHLGRYLEPNEIVHHENEIRDDNRIENLKLKTNHSAHASMHARRTNIQQHKMGKYSRDRPDVTREEVVALLKQGLSQRKIAGIFRVSPATISHRMTKGDPVSFCI